MWDEATAAVEWCGSRSWLFRHWRRGSAVAEGGCLDLTLYHYHCHYHYHCRLSVAPVARGRGARGRSQRTSHGAPAVQLRGDREECWQLWVDELPAGTVRLCWRQ